MTDRYTKDFPVSWEEIHRNAKALAWRLADMGEWAGVAGIARGGLVPACIVARELDLRHVETLCIVSYDHKDQGDAKIIKMPELPNGGAGWLIIDDLSDTGTTFKLVREHYPNAHLACIYAKPAGKGAIDTFITELSQDTWIHFPWDMATEYSVPIVDQRRDGRSP